MKHKVNMMPILPSLVASDDKVGIRSRFSTILLKQRAQTLSFLKLVVTLQSGTSRTFFQNEHDDVIKWNNFPRNWPFVRGIHWSPVNSPHKGQWRGALVFSLICVWANGWVNNRDAGDLGRHGAHYDVTVLKYMHHSRMSYSVKPLLDAQEAPNHYPYSDYDPVTRRIHTHTYI